MVAATRQQTLRHSQALATSTALAGYYREMYQTSATMVSRKKVIRLLNDAKVNFVLMGTHGLGGWRSQARATEDVDVLVAKKDHEKAVRALKDGYPKLLVEDTVIVTRFRDPANGKPRIDVMKPLQKVYQMAFRHTQQVGETHRVPDLEMALISKFAAMVSPYRERLRKMQDAVDFADIVVHNQAEIDRNKLARLAEQVYSGGRREIVELINNILEGRPLQV